MPDAPTWQWKDGWVLASVISAHAGGHDDLAGVIAAGDAINHAILNRLEIERTVNRLREARLVDADDPFVPLQLAMALWERAAADGGLVATARRLVVLMNQECSLLEAMTPWYLSEDVYRRALDRCRQR